MRALFTAALTPAALLLGLAIAGPASAQLVVPIDHSTRLAVNGAAASVVVGNPQVADVTVVDSHTLFVSGRGYGETDVVVLDRAGRTIYSGDVIVAAGGSGRVSVYRGADRTDLACAPNCSVSTRSPTGPSEKGAAGGGGSAGSTTPLGALAGAFGGATAGGAASTGAAMSTGAATPS
jgi:hypothetical protein